MSPQVVSPASEDATGVASRRDRVLAFLLGHDLFISYARADALGYAARLRNRLAKLGFRCYLDQLDAPPSPETSAKVFAELGRSTALIIIGTPRAAASKAVGDEVKFFSKLGRPILAIDVEGALAIADWREAITGLPLGRETSRSIASGRPSREVISRIYDSVQFKRRNRQLQRTAFLLLGAIGLVAILGTGVSGYFANRTKSARHEAALADDEKSRAVQSAAAAEMSRIQAEKDLKRAQDETALAIQATRDATAAARAAEGERLRAVRLAQAQQATAQSIALANASTRKIASGLLEEGTSDAIAAVRRVASVNERTAESDRALRNSLAVFPNIVLRTNQSGPEFRDASFSPDGQQFVILNEDQSISIYDRQGKEVLPEVNAAGRPGKIAISRVAVSNGLARLAILRADVQAPRSEVTIRDIKSGREWNLPPIPLFVFEIALSPNGKYLVFVPSRGTAQLWDVDERKAVATLEPSKSNPMIQKVPAFSPNGRAVAIGGLGSGQGRITAWTGLPEGEVTWTQEEFDAHRRELPVGRELPDVLCLAIANDARRYAACDGTLWGPALRGGSDRVERIAFMPNGSLTRAISLDGTGQFVSTINLTLRDPDRQRVALATDRGVGGWSYNVWDSSGYRSIATIAYPSRVHALRFDRHGATLSIIGDPDDENGLVREWRTTDWQEEVDKRLGRGAEGSVKGPAEGRFVSTIEKGEQQVTVDVWDTAARNHVRLSLGECFDEELVEENLLVSADGNTLVVPCLVEDVSLSAVVFRREARRFKEARRIELSEAEKFSSISADGSLLILAGEEGGAHFVDLSKGKEWALQTAPGDAAMIDKTLLSPDASMLAVRSLVFRSLATDKTNGRTGVAELSYYLDIKKPSGGGSIQRLIGAFTDFAFSADSKCLAAADIEGHVTIVDLVTSVVSRIRLSDSREVSFVAFGSESRLLAAVTEEGVHVIDIKKRREIAEIPNAGTAVLDAIAFSPDGKSIAVAENDPYGQSARVKIWLLDPGQLSRQAEEKLKDLETRQPVGKR